MMTWEDILKVDLREARMLGRKHAPEEMSAGKLKVVVEKAIAGGILDMSQSNLYKLRRNQFTSEQLLNAVRFYSRDIKQRGVNHLIGDGLKIHNVEVKPQKNRDRGEPANTLLDDPYPEEKEIITIEYSVGSINNERFSFALPPMTKNLSLSNLRRPETKRVKGSMKQRNINQHIGFDKKEDVN